MKIKALFRFVCLPALLAMVVGLYVPASAAHRFSSRPDFDWGVTGHHGYSDRGYEAYPESKLEEQIRLAAELGSKVYRFNFNPVDFNQYKYMDKVLQYCKAYGMELMLVLDRPYNETDPNAVYETAKATAKVFKGRIKYYQAYNELDIPPVIIQGQKIDPNNQSGAGDGSVREHYDINTLMNSVRNLKYMCKGLRESDPDAKIVVNFGFIHTYFLEYCIEQKVDFDMIGWDIYSHNHGVYKSCMNNKLLTYGKDLIICETNLWDGSLPGAEDDQVAWHDEFMQYCYSQPRIKGYIIYELLDEPAQSDHHQNGSNPLDNEAHYGLVVTQRNGTVVRLKKAYTEIQSWWGGKSMKNVKVGYKALTPADIFGEASSQGTRSESTAQSSSTAPGRSEDPSLPAGSDGSVPAETGAFERLSKLVGSARGLSGEYEPDLWADFETVIGEAEALLSRSGAAQDEYAAMFAKLKNAFESLGVSVRDDGTVQTQGAEDSSTGVSERKAQGETDPKDGPSALIFIIAGAALAVCAGIFLILWRTGKLPLSKKPPAA